MQVASYKWFLYHDGILQFDNKSCINIMSLTGINTAACCIILVQCLLQCNNIIAITIVGTQLEE